MSSDMGEATMNNDNKKVWGGFEETGSRQRADGARVKGVPGLGMGKARGDPRAEVTGGRSLVDGAREGGV